MSSRGFPQTDRYIPRNGRDEYYPSRYDRSSRDSAPSRPDDAHHTREKHQDPHTLSMQVSFSQFCSWLRQEQRPGDAELTRDQLTEKYANYKLDLYARLARGFMIQHKDEEWFKEKYDPIVADPIKKSIIEYRKLNFKDFMEELDQGKYDEFSLESERPQLSMPSSYKQENEAAAVKVDNSETDATVPNPEPMQIDDEVQALAPATDDPKRKVLLIKTIAPHVTRKQLEDLAKTIPGFLFLSLSDPNPAKRYHRIGWIMLSPETDAQSSVDLIDGKTIETSAGDFMVHAGVHTLTRPMKRKYLNNYLSSEEYIKRDHLNSYKIAKKLESELEDSQFADGIDKIRERAKTVATKKLGQQDDIKKTEAEDEEEGMVVEVVNEADREISITKKELDFTYLYLRQVFSFCYYCICNCDSICDLTKRCAAGHIRRVLPGADADEATKQSFASPDTQTESFIQSWKSRFDLFIDSTASDLIKLGGRPLEESLVAETDAHIKQEDEGKFRCKVAGCTKLFKGEDFCRKHIEKRHPEFIENVTRDSTLLNKYVLDPCRVLPPRHEGNPPYMNQKDQDPASKPATDRPAKFLGLPVAYPHLAPTTSTGHSRVPAAGYLQADPFAYAGEASDPKANQANPRAGGSAPNHYSPMHNRGNNERRRSYNRSRSPPNRRDSFGRRDGRDGRDGRDTRDGRDYRDRSDYRQSDYHSRKPRPEGVPGDPRGRKLTSYIDIETAPPPSLNY
ncbi:hypothetical protein V1512DRAFT_260317 [Lipomyces arxii]|uniref:uncharacterized protein n=1 Tax=Lipomyces arxii TaxID=56418 RepID=UPI0034CF0CAF